MPTVKDELGNTVSEQPYTPEGESKAEQIASANPNWEVDYAPGGSYNAMNRSVTDYAGLGNTGYNKIGMYKKGGQVGKNLKAQVKQAGGEAVEEVTKEVPVEEEI